MWASLRSDCDGISLLILLLQTGCGSILTSETTSQPNSAQTSQLFVGLKLPTSICFGIYLLPNYGTKNIVMIKQIHFSGMINVSEIYQTKYELHQLGKNCWSNQGNKNIFKGETILKTKTLKSCLELKCQVGHLFWFASLCHNIKFTKWIAVFSTALSTIPTFCANYF